MKKNLLFVSCLTMGLLLTACGNPAGGSGGQGGGGADGVIAQWDAQVETKECSDGFDSSGKLKAVGDYVQYTFNAKAAAKARLWCEVENRTDSPYDRETQTGNQSVWWDYYNGRENGGAWKYTITVNEEEIDLDAQGTYKVGEEDVALKELMYTDFLNEDEDNPVVPFFVFNVKAGENTVKIERSNGYSVSFQSFKVVEEK